MDKWENKSKKRYLILIIFILSIISTLSMGDYALRVQKKSLDETYKCNAEQLMSIISQTIEDKVKSYEDTIKLLCSMSNFSDLSSLKQDMKIFNQSDDTIIDIYFCDEATGKLTSSLDYDVSVLGVNDARALQWYKELISGSKELIVTCPYRNIETGKLISSIFKAVVVNDRKVGVIALDVDLSQVQEQLSVFKYGKTGELEITDTYGNILAHKDKTKIGSNEPSEYPGWEEISSSPSGSFKFRFNSVDYRGYYTSYSPLGWIMILKNDISEFRIYGNKTFWYCIINVSILIVCETIIFIVFLKKEKLEYKREKI